MLLFTWPYNFELSCENPSLFSRNVCQVFHLTRYAVIWIIPQHRMFPSNIKRTIRHYLNFKRRLNIRFDAIKKLSPGARSALNLYECAVSPGNSDSTLWIFKEQPCVFRHLLIDQYQSTQKEPPQHVQSRFCFEWSWTQTPTWNPNDSISDGGGWRDRTDDPLLAKQVLSQLS